MRCSDGRTWSVHWRNLERLISPLYEAGWIVDEDDAFSDDGEEGPFLAIRLFRSDMALQITYEPARRTITLGPGADEWVEDDAHEQFDRLKDEVVVDLAESRKENVYLVQETIRRLGLLEATRIILSEDAGTDITTPELTGQWMDRHLIEPVALNRGEMPSETLAAMMSYEPIAQLMTMLRLVTPGVLPDPAPGSAALGLVEWSWRNTDAVEYWHSLRVSDVLMAKANITMTRLALPLVEPQGVDWPRVLSEFTEPNRALVDGRLLADIFGAGWPEIVGEVHNKLSLWQDIDREFGAVTSLRFLAMYQAAISGTHKWWGSVQWPDRCRQAIEEIVTAGLVLPAPYNKARGEDLLIRQLIKKPEHLPDSVLDFCIDPPSSPDGQKPPGLRMTQVHRPPACEIF